MSHYENGTIGNRYFFKLGWIEVNPNSMNTINEESWIKDRTVAMSGNKESNPTESFKGSCTWQLDAPIKASVCIANIIP